MATKKSTPTEPTEATAADKAVPFTGFTPIVEARALLLRFAHKDTEKSSFMKGDVLEYGRYCGATVAGVYIVAGGFVAELALRDGSTVTLFSNAEFSADIPEGA